MTHSASRLGLSLIEVLIALAVLAIGVFALASLQASSLQYSSRAEELRIVTQIAEAELEWRRQTRIQPARTDCESIIPAGFQCSVEIVPIGALGNDIAVTVRSRSAEITLSAFTTGQRYISGQVPDIVGILDDETDDEETGETPPPAPPPPALPPVNNPGKGKGKGGG